MIKSLQLLILFRKAAAVSPYSGIHTDSVLLARLGGRKIPRVLNEPGIRNRKNILKEDSEFPDEVIDEHELDDELDMSKIDKVFDEDIRKDRRHREKVQLKITVNKFFKAKPQPLMLTHNERLCIQYLHKQDPVQWDFKTLSESFPATPDTIRKIIKSKCKFTPERIKKMDSIAQKNWELLSEGKLNADPHVLKHLNKFVNRREILLEQIKNETFYLPQIKSEPVWNQGEMNSIIKHYEKTVEKLAQKSDSKALTCISSDIKSETKESKSNLDLVYEQIKAEAVNIPETKDSFKFGDMIDTYRKQTTLEELENKILEKAERRKNLELSEKVILDNKLRGRKESYKNLVQSSTPFVRQEKMRPFMQDEMEHVMQDNMRPVMQEKMRRRSRAEKEALKEFDDMDDLDDDLESSTVSFESNEPEEFSTMLEDFPPDENTYSGSEADVGKILDKLQNKPELEETPPETKVKKKEIDFSDPERLARENVYFDKEVFDIKDTSFWDSKRSSREKALAEASKMDLDEPVLDESPRKSSKIFVFAPDPYPERIKIPKHKKGSGMTFRIKDCYYDDDGEFLYRVPGMTK